MSCHQTFRERFKHSREHSILAYELPCKKIAHFYTSKSGTWRKVRISYLLEPVLKTDYTMDMLLCSYIVKGNVQYIRYLGPRCLEFFPSQGAESDSVHHPSDGRWPINMEWLIVDFPFSIDRMTNAFIALEESFLLQYHQWTSKFILSTFYEMQRGPHKAPQRVLQVDTTNEFACRPKSVFHLFYRIKSKLHGLQQSD